MKHALPTAEVLSYPHPDGEIRVTHLGPKDARETMALQIMSVMGRAYADEFEGRGIPNVTDGTMRHHFDLNDPARVAQHQKRMATAMERGSSYWLALDQQDGRPPDVLSLAKVSLSYPSLAHRLGIKPPELYINDIAARPEQSSRGRRGLGSVVLHSALAYGGYNSNALVTADTYKDGQSSPAFFAAHGFDLQEGVTPEPTTLRGLEGTFDMAMQRYEAPSLDDVVRIFEERQPWLAEARIIR